MGLFDRLFGRKPEQPTVQKAEPLTEKTPEQRRQEEIEIYVAKRGKKPRVLSEDEIACTHEGQRKKNKPIPKEEREEIIRDLAKEMASYISIGGPKDVANQTPLEETSAFKRFVASGLERKSPPAIDPKSLVDYDQLIDDLVSRIPLEWIQSEAYWQGIKMLKHHLSRYQNSGREGWVFLAALDERDRPEYVNLHGQVFKFGSPEEVEALKLMIQPGSRCRPKAWFNDPQLDTPPEKYKKQRDKWFEKMALGNR